MLITAYKSIPIVRYALDMITAELPTKWKHHTLPHTTDVIEEVMLFAHYDNLTTWLIYWLIVAGAYHDTGYINGPTLGHEERSIEIFKKIAPKYHVPERMQILVESAIRGGTCLHMVDGKLIQRPPNRFAAYLSDADLSYLGRMDYMEIHPLVFHDLDEPNELKSYQRALQFFNDHTWQTHAGRLLRTAEKNNNIARIRAKINELK